MRAWGLRPRRGRACLAVSARPVSPSTKLESVGSLKSPQLAPRGADFAAQWPARMYPYRRFAIVLAVDDARLGASAVRYSFTVRLFHSFQLTDFDRRTQFRHRTRFADALMAALPHASRVLRRSKIPFGSPMAWHSRSSAARCPVRRRRSACYLDSRSAFAGRRGDLLSEGSKVPRSHLNKSPIPAMLTSALGFLARIPASKA